MVPRPRRGQLILSHQLAARYASPLPLGSSVSPGLGVRMSCDVVSNFPVPTHSQLLSGVLRDPCNTTRKQEPSSLGPCKALPSLPPPFLPPPRVNISREGMMAQELERSLSKIFYLSPQIFSPFEGLGTWRGKARRSCRVFFIFQLLCAHVSVGAMNVELTISC